MGQKPTGRCGNDSIAAVAPAQRMPATMSMVSLVVLSLSFIPTPAQNVTDAMITVTKMKLSLVLFALAAAAEASTAPRVEKCSLRGARRSLFPTGASPGAPRAVPHRRRNQQSKRRTLGEGRHRTGANPVPTLELSAALHGPAGTTQPNRHSLSICRSRSQTRCRLERCSSKRV